MRDINSDYFGVLLDGANTREKHYEMIEKLAPYAVSVHAKTHSRNARDEFFELDYERIFRTLKAAGFKGYVAIEYEYTEPALPAVRRFAKNSSPCATKSVDKAGVDAEGANRPSQEEAMRALMTLATMALLCMGLLAQQKPAVNPVKTTVAALIENPDKFHRKFVEVEGEVDDLKRRPLAQATPTRPSNWIAGASKSRSSRMGILTCAMMIRWL